MHRVKGPAILLHSKVTGEADLVVNLLHREYGKAVLLAKSALKSKKRFLGALELFNLLEVEFVARPSGPFLGRLESSAVLEPFPRFRKNAGAFGLAAYACELCEAVTRAADPGVELFDWLLGFLRALDRDGVSDTMTRALELDILDLTGYGPALERCSACGSELAGASWFSYDVSRGGAICGSCEGPSTGLSNSRISLGTLKSLDALRRIRDGRPTRLKLSKRSKAEAKRLLQDFLHYHLGIEAINSRSFLEAVHPTLA